MAGLNGLPSLIASRRARCGCARRPPHTAVERSADRRLRPRARHAEPLQHAHPRRHPVLRRRRADDHRRADERRAAAGRARCRRSRTAACGSGPTAAWTSPGSCGPGVKWHDGTPLHVRRREVHRRRDQRSRLQPREHRRLRPHQLGRHARLADRDRPLPGGLRAVRDAVHPRRCCRSTCSRDATSTARTTTTAIRSAPVPTGWPSGRPANTSCSSACPTTGAATSTRRSAGCCSSSSRTPTRASTS